jgi:pentatricopeptide repeat protein
MTVFPFQEIHDFILSLWVELFFVFVFGLAFAMMRSKSKKGKCDNKVSGAFNMVHAHVSSGNPSLAVAAWRKIQAQQPTPQDILRLVTQAFIDAEPLSMVNELVDHFRLHKEMRLTKSAYTVLEVVARAGQDSAMENLFDIFVNRFQIPATNHMQEIMLGGYALAGDESKVMKLLEELRGSGHRTTVRAYSVMVKSFLKNSLVDPALMLVHEMHAQGLNVPAFALSEIFRVARESGRTAEIFQTVVQQQALLLTPEAVAVVLEDCLNSKDLVLAKTVDEFVRQTNLQLNFAGYEALLKLYTGSGETRALEVFSEVQSKFPNINEGLYVSIISRCAEPKFLRLAEQVVGVLRARSKMSITVYSALMKVYSYCNMYNEACDLYEQIRADKLEPDTVMYGCLMKFSAECGRTDLTKELSTKIGGLDIYHHMSLIRAAGQDKDVSKAFTILGKLQKTEAHIDTAVYNAVLDVCSSVGDMGRARELATQMKRDNLMDIISYNTLLKGYCMRGDSKSAHQIVVDMEAGGHRPNDVSYNCLINLAASSGDFDTAWRTIETMEKRQVRIDQYTVSTMMKALKRVQNGRDNISRVFALLDRHHIDVCCEEVLLNTALEACMKHGENRRLEVLIKSMRSRANMQIAPHSYANLIKASGNLNKVQQCWDLWVEMTETRRLEPTGVALGCMLDALVCNDAVERGVELLRQWQHRVPLNTVHYSTLIKGFTNNRDTQGASIMWNELRASGLPMNTVVYNGIIDAHARVGHTKEVATLLKSMEDDGIEPDDITKSIVVKGYCMTGELDKAMQVFCGLPAQPNQNNVIVYNTILDGCCRHNRNDLADKLLANMEEYNITPSNYTLGIVVKMWGRRKNLAEALTAVEVLPKKYGFRANGPVRTCLLFACLRNDAVDKALDVFDEIRIAGNHADSKLFSALVNNCAKTGKFKQAVALVEEAYGLAPGTRRLLAHNDDLEHTCVDHLMKALSKQGQYQALGTPLIKSLRAAKVCAGNGLP